MTFGESVFDFYQHMEPPPGIPEGVESLLPFDNPETQRVVKAFMTKYYHDSDERRLIMGINPGRFGSGLTGIGFTDPIRLETVCGIANPFDKKPELSSRFIYEVIEAYGGVEAFYRQFFISAVSPIGFVKHGKNYNYYDDPILQEAVKPFAIRCLEEKLRFGCSSKVAVCVGQGKNLDFLQRINEEHHFFDDIRVVPHPRWVMQYRLKTKAKYIDQYLEVLEAVS